MESEGRGEKEECRKKKGGVREMKRAQDIYFQLEDVRNEWNGKRRPRERWVKGGKSGGREI